VKIKTEFIIMCLLIMLIYTLYKLWFCFCRSCTEKSKAGEHYSIDVDAPHTCEVCIIVLPILVYHAERHMEEKHHTAEQDCMCCALMSDSIADCRMTVLL